jgi:hypothetical protein
MDHDKKRAIKQEIYQRQLWLQLLAGVFAWIALALVGVVLFFIFRGVGPSSDDLGMDEMEASMMRMFSAALLAVIIVVLVPVLGGIFKYLFSLAHFWYGRALALELYESEKIIPLKDLMTSLAPVTSEPANKTTLEKVGQTIAQLKQR